MKRRRLLQLALAALACPAALRAQPAGRPARVGVLSSTSPEARSAFWDAFKDGMAKLGWVEGRNVTYVYRYTRGDASRFDALASELVAEKPDLVYAGIEAAAVAVKRATRDIPIVFGFVNDPVGSGLVASLARPGGNATGLASNSFELNNKRLELLREVRPQLRVVAWIGGRGLEGDRSRREIERAARLLGTKVDSTAVGNQSEMEKALSSLAGKKVDGLLFLAGGILGRNVIVDRVAALRLPAVYAISELVESGGLMSYGADLAGNYRYAATYVDRILKGAKPADLPVELPTTYELVVNLRAAKEQGIAIPQSVLLRATRVIE